MTYYILLFVVVYKCNFREMLSGEIPSDVDNFPPDDISVIGKSKYVFSPLPDTEKVATVAPLIENSKEEEEIYVPTPEEEEEDEESLYTRYEGISEVPAVGFTFEEIQQLKTVVNSEDANEDEKEKALDTMQQIRNTPLLEQIIANIPYGEEKVNRLIQDRMKQYQEMTETSDETDDLPEDDTNIQTFNIDNYA